MQSSKDFIQFKASVLYQSAKGDPIKKAETIREIVQSIAVIPDQIKRTVFLKETSAQFDMDEQILLNELNKIVRNINT